MRQGLIGGAVVAGLWLASGVAYADTTIIARAGPWEAFAGTSTDGTKVCGVSTSWDDDRYFGVKYYKGDDTITIQMGSPKWTIDDGAKQRVVMKIDRNSDWTATASGMHFSKKDAGLQFEIAKKQLSIFVQEFGDGEQLRLSFPGSDADDWTVSLQGTETLIGSFDNCIKAM
jgi:hypothetical protein